MKRAILEPKFAAPLIDWRTVARRVLIQQSVGKPMIFACLALRLLGYAVATPTHDFPDIRRRLPRADIPHTKSRACHAPYPQSAQSPLPQQFPPPHHALQPSPHSPNLRFLPLYLLPFFHPLPSHHFHPLPSWLPALSLAPLLSLSSTSDEGVSVPHLLFPNLGPGG